jgi:hypothetical protein
MLHLSPTYELTESMVIDILIEVHKIKKISKQQLIDIFSVKPNYLAPAVDQTNQFFDKMVRLAVMSVLQDTCERGSYAYKHPKSAAAVDAYFDENNLERESCREDAIHAYMSFRKVGRLCVDTEKFIN